MSSRNEGPDLPVEPDELPDSDETVLLAARARDGDRQALNELIARHQDWLRRVVRIKLRGPSGRVRRFFDSMDIVQEVMETVFQKIGDLDVRSAPGVRQWLAQIATYQIGDCLKYGDAEKRNPDLESDLFGRVPEEGPARHDGALAASGTRPDERAWREELKAILDDAVSLLPEHYQEVVLLRDYAKEDWAEIRRRTNKPTIGATKLLYHRAWVKIRKSTEARLGTDGGGG